MIRCRASARRGDLHARHELRVARAHDLAPHEDLEVQGVRGHAARSSGRGSPTSAAAARDQPPGTIDDPAPGRFLGEREPPPARTDGCSLGRRGQARENGHPAGRVRSRARGTQRTRAAACGPRGPLQSLPQERKALGNEGRARWPTRNRLKGRLRPTREAASRPPRACGARRVWEPMEGGLRPPSVASALSAPPTVRPRPRVRGNACPHSPALPLAHNKRVHTSRPGRPPRPPP